MSNYKAIAYKEKLGDRLLTSTKFNSNINQCTLKASPTGGY
ncbi:hypothetical protein [Anabaena azotica]|nr:hypothetical protein [Anabaena azotica]